MLARRNATATLSTANLLHNLQVIKQKIYSATANTKIIAAVKANAYGHGLEEIALRLEKHVDMLGVAFIDEALFLRKIGIKIPIILLEGVFVPTDLAIAAAQNFQVVFHQENQVSWLENLTLPKPLNAWLKIDSGMGRLGFDVEQSKYFYQKLSNNFFIASVGVMSHFACADNIDHPLNQRQIEVFKSFTYNIKAKLSFCNSAAIFNFSSSYHDYVRPGLALYGSSPLADKSSMELNLKPVMTLKTSLISIKKLLKGGSVGYKARYVCSEDTLVGVAAIGYGDGYPRSARDGTPILVNNIKCPLIGTVSMDMITINLNNAIDAKLGDMVTLWGENLPIEEVAKFTDNVAYDLLTGVRDHIKFKWV
jgi:alanine racemase